MRMRRGVTENRSFSAIVTSAKIQAVPARAVPISMQKSTLQEILLICYFGWGISGLFWLMPLKSRIRARYGKAATHRHLQALAKEGDVDAIEHKRRGRIWAVGLVAFGVALWTVKWYG